MAEHEIKFIYYFFLLMQTKKKVCVRIIQVKTIRINPET